MEIKITLVSATLVYETRSNAKFFYNLLLGRVFKYAKILISASCKKNLSITTIVVIFNSNLWIGIGVKCFRSVTHVKM